MVRPFSFRLVQILLIEVLRERRGQVVVQTVVLYITQLDWRGRV